MSRTHITNLYGVGGIATVAQRRTVEVAKQLGFNEISILYDNGLRDPEEFDKKVAGRYSYFSITNLDYF